MIYINLLPFRAARKKENVRRQISVFLLTFAFTAVALWYYNGTLNSRITILETDIQTKKTDLATYKKTIQEINKIKAQLTVLNNKIKIINQLNVNRTWPARFLDTINDMVIEKRMWLTSLQSQGANINIKGIAIDNKTVADFMTRIEGSELFTNVTLNTVSHQKIRQYNLKSFQISCQKAPPKKKKPANTAKPKGKAK
ncbi:PilN domain-containing protein [Thermodesulfobacteriota bacterium]